MKWGEKKTAKVDSGKPVNHERVPEYTRGVRSLEGNATAPLFESGSILTFKFAPLQGL
jgi:hypothetical protein